MELPNVHMYTLLPWKRRRIDRARRRTPELRCAEVEVEGAIRVGQALLKIRDETANQCKLELKEDGLLRLAGVVFSKTDSITD